MVNLGILLKLLIHDFPSFIDRVPDKPNQT